MAEATTIYGDIARGGTIDGSLIIDEDSNEALLVRKNQDGGDVLAVNTNNDLITCTGYTSLGSDGPQVKMKELSGTTGSSEGSSTNIAHGLTIGTVISVTGLVTASDNNVVPPAFTWAAEYEWHFYLNTTNVVVALSATNSGNLLSRPVSLLIVYRAPDA